LRLCFYEKIENGLKDITMLQRMMYQTPRVLRTVPVSLGDEILSGSVADKSAVVSAGQTVETYDMNPEQDIFNHTWGE
jgi:hypothetical protein